MIEKKDIYKGKRIVYVVEADYLDRCIKDNAIVISSDLYNIRSRKPYYMVRNWDDFQVYMISPELMFETREEAQEFVDKAVEDQIKRYGSVNEWKLKWN